MYAEHQVAPTIAPETFQDILKQIQYKLGQSGFPKNLIFSSEVVEQDKTSLEAAFTTNCVGPNLLWLTPKFPSSDICMVNMAHNA